MGTIDWASLVLATGNPEVRWRAIFEAVAGLAKGGLDAGEFEQALDAGDRLIADAAYDLWETFPTAPSVVRALQSWWDDDTGGDGRAVLILDALSVREMRLILRAAADRGTPVASAQVAGSTVPTDTQAFAKALGLTGRAQLKASGYGPNFIFGAEKPWTDVSEGFDFASLSGHVPAEPDIVLWDAWPDRLLHDSADKSSGPKHFATTAQQVLHGDGFWRLVDRLRQGRRLVVTADHGYAISHRFVDLPSGIGEKMRLCFGASRCGTIPADSPGSPAHPPLYLTAGDRAAVVGPWKWKSPGGYPHLNHGGLTLGEVCVPFITFEAIT